MVYLHRGGEKIRVLLHTHEYRSLQPFELLLFNTTTTTTYHTHLAEHKKASHPCDATGVQVEWKREI